MSQDLYRNRDFIPDFDELLAETAARSRELSRGVEVRADVPYGNGPRERVALSLPERAATGAPVHMFVHGGYGRSARRGGDPVIAAPVVAAGGVAASVGYDLMRGTPS